MILKVNEEFKDQKFDLKQVYFFSKFFSIQNPIDFNRLTSIMDVYEDRIVDLKKPNLIKMLNLQIMPDALDIQNTIKGLLTESFNMNTAIFASLNKNGISETHHDMESVFLIPTHGLVNYVIYEGEKFIRSFQLGVGDLLVIPKNITHSAIPLCPRIVISVGVYN